MPSPLRSSLSVDTQSTQSYYPTSTSSSPSSSPAAKKQKMSLTQTYYVASTARTKLGREASRADHDLRLLVGHANLLDVLMVELQEAEREQEAWYNESVRKADKPAQSRHIQWIDSIAEEFEDDSDSDSDSDDDVYDEEDMDAEEVKPELFTVSSREIDIDEEDEYAVDFDDFEYDGAALTRVESHPPELVHEDSSDSEDESLPPSPQFEKYTPTQPIKTQSHLDKIDHHDDLFMVSQQGPMITAY